MGHVQILMSTGRCQHSLFPLPRMIYGDMIELVVFLKLNDKQILAIISAAKYFNHYSVFCLCTDITDCEPKDKEFVASNNNF